MTDIALFHHALGQTTGFLSFAGELRAAGHTVHTPDLFDGMTFSTIDDGVAYAKQAGFDTILERGRVAAEPLPSEMVYAGFSLGVMPAQMLAQSRPGAKAAVLLHAAVPAAEFGGAWPDGVALQIHLMEKDPFALEGDLDAARELEATVAGAELFLYPGDGHLFTDPGTADYDADAAALVMQRILALLAGLGS